MIKQEGAGFVAIWPFVNQEDLSYGYLPNERIWIVTDPELLNCGDIIVDFALDKTTRERWDKFCAAMEEAFKIAENAMNVA
jgi:hypothetical protein